SCMSRVSAGRRAKAVFTKARYINSLRDRAVHEERQIKPGDAAGAVKELFHVCFWFARTYARKARPADGVAFDASLLPANHYYDTSTLLCMGLFSIFLVGSES